MFALGVLAFVLIAAIQTGSEKDMGGAFATATVLSMSIAVGGSVMARHLSTQLSRDNRNFALATTLVLLAFAGLGCAAPYFLF